MQHLHTSYRSRIARNLVSIKKIEHEHFVHPMKNSQLFPTERTMVKKFNNLYLREITA